jgi:alanine racemase
MTFLDKEKVLSAALAHRQKESSSSWIEIDKKALEHNILSFKNIIKPALLALVVKSNAYGHGIEHIAKICDQNSLVDWLCLASLSEALFLRSIGIKKPLLVLGIVDESLERAILENIDIVVYDLPVALELNRIGEKLQKVARVHIKIDTGLSRLGLTEDDALSFIKYIHTLPFIYIHGISTHFANSENADQAYTNYQIKRFKHVLEQLRLMGIDIPIQHMSCSAATTASIDSHCNMVRVGIGTYGLWPSQDNKYLTLNNYTTFSLKPVLTWKTKVIQVKEIPPGTHVGYDLTYKAEAPTQVATIPVGYWDGYDRKLSNQGKVLINNQLVPIVGRVAMNLSMINITGLNVSVGDEVTLLGNHLGVTADDIALYCQTINYEVVTRINPLLPRFIKE